MLCSWCFEVKQMVWNPIVYYSVLRVHFVYICCPCLCYRSDEIVMPSEHTGLVRENYLWKVKCCASMVTLNTLCTLRMMLYYQAQFYIVICHAVN